jgi:hypothetical protein
VKTINYKIYVKNHYNFIDNLIKKKRLEIAHFVNKKIKEYKIKEVLDIGTTNDESFKSSNVIINNLKNINKYKSISDQIITLKLFSKKYNKSITSKFSNKEIKYLSSDLVISNATIEHVGSKKNQTQMLKNVISLTKKIFIIITPNKYYPIDFHTKIPFFHWLPKKIFRKLLKAVNLDFFSLEKNLNLLSENDLIMILNNFNKKIVYKIHYIKLLGFISNLIVVGKKIKKYNK